MFAALLSALMGGAGLMVQSNAANDANNINWQNFFLQRDTARENEKLAKATRTDALGNSVEYIPGMGFVTKATPMTKALLNSIQHENTQRNTVDAPLKRRQLISNSARRETESEASKKELAAFQYGSRKTEGEFASDAEDIALRGYDQANEDTTQALGRQAVRAGNSGALRDVFKESNKQRGQSLVDALMGAKTQGQQMFGAQEQMRSGQLQRALGLSQSAGATDATPMGESDAVGRLQGQSNSQFSELMRAIMQGAQAQGGALSQVADSTMAGGSAMAQAFAKIAEAFGGMNFGSEKAATAKPKSFYDSAYDERTLGNMGAW